MHIISRILIAFALVFVGFVIVPASAEGQTAAPPAKIIASLDLAEPITTGDWAGLVVVGGWVEPPYTGLGAPVVRMGATYYYDGKEYKSTLAEGWANYFRPDVGYRSFTMAYPTLWFKGWMTRLCVEYADWYMSEKSGNPVWRSIGCRSIILRSDGDERSSVSFQLYDGRGDRVDQWSTSVEVRLLRSVNRRLQIASQIDWQTGNCFVADGSVSCWQGSSKIGEQGLSMPHGEYVLAISAPGHIEKFLPFSFYGNVDFGPIFLELK